MKRAMFAINEVASMISSEKRLLLAGDEHALEKLPPGNWIGGTIPYFMTEKGGVVTKEEIYVAELPDFLTDFSVRRYDEWTIGTVFRDAPGNGFSVIIIPAKSRTHFSFALHAPNFEQFAVRPLIGWISGVHLDDLGKVSPKVFDGRNGEPLEEGAVVLHASLPQDKVADIDIINIFEQGDGDTIVFPEDGFTARDVFINGRKRNFAGYLGERQLDKRLPLVADYHGARLNTSFQEGPDAGSEVRFYAPVFSGLEYRHARPVENFVEQFSYRVTGGMGDQVFFSCNCILNYLYSGLKSKSTGIPGPTTFGEIAYQLLNQTMVYLRIIDLPRPRQ
jgi:hypothetical protein